MKNDKDGFIFPCIDENKCVQCQMCVNHCPQNNQSSWNEMKNRMYLLHIRIKRR